MREIKFRAWDKYNHCWIYFRLKDFFITEYGENIKDKLFWINYEHWGQYTDRKDKNSKEIYNGDILQIIVKYKKSELDDKTAKSIFELPSIEGYYTKKGEKYIVKFGEYDNQQGYEEQDDGIGFYVIIPGKDKNYTITGLYSFMNFHNSGDVFLFNPKRYSYTSEVEVIGNIYKNPELLEESS